uniref:HTH cro/C1-type domain-containing protein n=1 Tax=Rheinheimera sp. BAL341 TaxID=1708203 RepID=A0A486XJS6_9GAMM
MEYPLLSPSQLSAFVEGLRKQAGYTQTQAGELLGISQQAYARIEKAPEKVSVERFMLILKLLQAQLSVKFTPGLKALPREAWLAKDSTHVHQRSLASEQPDKRNVVSKGNKSDPSGSTYKPQVIVKPTGKKSSW